MNRERIAIIGRLAKDSALLDGQTVKTKILYEELCRRFPNTDVVCVDTYLYRKRMIPLFFQMLGAFIRCKHIFVLLSRNGRTFLFPLLTSLNRLFRRRLYHDVIGGALATEAKERPALCRQLRRFEVNWVELPQMKTDLEALGVYNAEVLPNFKRLHILQEDALSSPHEPPFVFTMFSRVIKEKGIGAAMEAVNTVNEACGTQKALLRIYGPVEPKYQEEFHELLSRFGHCAQYMGCIPQDESVNALQGSYMLLFPSVYPGEGMPGTVIDAFSAGLPIIATDWHFNAELVHHGINGYGYDWTKPELLAHWIRYAVDNPEEINRMRPACLAEAAKYTPEAAMQQILRKMEETQENPA